jgi:hypothetical protein
MAIQALMGATHFLCKGLKAVRTEMSLHVLAYNIRRIMGAIGVARPRLIAVVNTHKCYIAPTR